MLFEVSVAYTAANFLLALIVFYRSRRNLVTRFYAFCVASLIGFGIASFFSGRPVPAFLFPILVHAAIFLYSLSPFFFLHFMVLFARRYDILQSKNVVIAIYFAGLFSYTMILLGFLAGPVTSEGALTQTGYVFYVTWMSVFFVIGIAMLYELTQGFYEKVEKANLLIGGFALLLLLLPGPFAESVLIGVFHVHVDIYYIFSTLAIVFAVYFIFRHKIIVNTVYDALKSALAVMKDVLVTTDEHYNIQMVRGGITSLLGYSEKEWLGHTLKDFIQEKGLLDEYRNYILEGKMKESHFDTTVLSKDGSYVPMNFSFTPMFLQEDLRGFVGVGRDTTELRRSEQAVRISEAKFRALFENVPDGVFQITPDRRIVTANRSFSLMLGYDTPEEILQLDFERDLFFDQHNRDLLLSKFEKGENARNLEVTLRRKDDKPVVALGNIHAVRDEHGIIQYYEGALTDITELKNLEEQLRHTQKMESIGMLAGGIAHDFNNILQIIIMNTMRFKRDQTDPESFPKAVDMINRSVQRGAALVRQLLTFARKTEIVFQSLNLNSTVEEIKKIVNQTFPETIDLKLDLVPYLPSVIADQTQIHQVLLNLCVNARDAMPRGGTLMITTRMVSGPSLKERFPDARESDYVGLTVADTGTGIDKATLERVFEPFFTTKEVGQGTGLGLAVVYGIMRSHRGFIDVESEIGRGTKFHMYLPVQAQDIDSFVKVTDQQQEIPGGSETILFAEDEEVLLDLLKSLLESKGYTVLTAKDGVQAVETYRKHYSEIAVVLMDLGLPKLSGWDAFMKMKEINRDVRVILCSGYLDPHTRSERLKEGAKDFVQKPYVPDEILSRIRGVLDVKKVDN